MQLHTAHHTLRDFLPQPHVSIGSVRLTAGRLALEGTLEDIGIGGLRLRLARPEPLALGTLVDCTVVLNGVKRPLLVLGIVRWWCGALDEVLGVHYRAGLRARDALLIVDRARASPER